MQMGKVQSLESDRPEFSSWLCSSNSMALGNLLALRKVGCLAGGVGTRGGASVGQRGGAEALRSTAPPWLPVGLGSGQVPGKLGAQDSLRLPGSLGNFPGCL